MAVLEFDPEQVRKLLQDGFAGGNFSASIRHHWFQYVPEVYSGSMDADSSKEERVAERILFKPMEEFLCGGKPDDVFKALKERDEPPQLCGKKFKMGEPTYSCRDCGMDPTCVLCITCFQNSTHKTHRYKMSTSGGGGYCDCGDKEAWKVDPFCSEHQVETSPAEQPARDPIGDLPPDIRARAQQLFAVCISYAAEILTWTETDRLPVDLMPGDLEDTFTTMLFNDEVHTYEQVINTLQKAVDCSQKEAIDFATTVDREGRSLVRNGPFVECNKAREIIEKTTTRLTSKSLKVLVMHSAVVAHQQFALRMLSWLQTTITYSDGLRKMFCLLSIEKQDGKECSIIETMLLADTQLWKVARVQSHQLFMSGVLMDQECKKKFAVIFTKIYDKMMEGFMEDDHDHSVCAVSESVQIFTVPTLARMLVTEHNLLHVIISTFLKHCKAKFNKDNKFMFDRQERNHQAFRRAQFALYDLKYALTCKPTPEEWDEKLHGNFLKGLESMCNLLAPMQGMDAVTRQAGTHIEFEPEWEGAFNLQLKLSDNIEMMLDWCGTRNETMIEAFSRIVTVIKTLQVAEEKIFARQMKQCTVANHTVKCQAYDVSLQPVSIHLPITRLLAGLYLRMNQAGLSLQERHLANGITAVELMEPSLRCLVMIAQTQAGMWRRNGYSLLNQIYFYHNVRCRSQMYDMDVAMIQVAAALANPNHFLIHLINKYALLNWIKEDYDKPNKNPENPEDSLRQIVALAGEFLDMLIIVIGERYTAGVGQVSAGETSKREIIHQLCIQPMAHSELAKTLPEDPYHETGIEEVVNQVATFKMGKDQMSKGMYELKPKFYSQYNPYFYHYSRADQSKAEQTQRKRRKDANESLALPPPPPPPFCKNLENITRLLYCDTMLLIMRTVLTRTSAKRSKSWSEVQFEKVLHLICLALYEDRRLHTDHGEEMKFIQRAALQSPSMLSLLEAAAENQTVAHNPSLIDLLAFTTKLYKDVTQLRDGASTMDSQDSQDATMSSSTPSSSKVALQRKKKAEMAAKRRNKLMIQMQRMQKDFIRGNSELFENTSTDIVATGTAMEVECSSASKPQYPVVVGPHCSETGVQGPRSETCILCQETQEILHDSRAIVLAAFIQKSTVLSQDKQRRQIKDPDTYDPLLMPSDLFLGTYSSTCGHTMHADCWQSYYDSVVARERRRTLRFRHRISFDIEKLEFLCPLCETLSNTVIPLMPSLALIRLESTKTNTAPVFGSSKESKEAHVELSFNDWLDGITKTVKNSTQQSKKDDEEDEWIFVPCPLSSITKMMAESVAKNFAGLFEYYAYGPPNCSFSDSITDMIKKYAADTYATGLGVNPDEDNARVPIMAWNTCAYSIMTTEQELRADSKPLFGQLPVRTVDCISSLIRFAASTSQVISPDIIKKHCAMLLSALASPSTYPGGVSPTLLDIELFHYLVSLTLSIPTLYAPHSDHSEGSSTSADSTQRAGGVSGMGRISSGSSLNDLHVLHWIYTAHIVQVMLSADFENQECMETETDEEGEAMMKYYIQVRKLAGLDVDFTPSPWQLYLYLKEACLPFLRCCALFFHYLTDVSPPAELEEIPACLGQYEPLCRYLSLPITPSVLFSQGDVLGTMINTWCTSSAVHEKLTKKPDCLVRYPLSVNQLVTLPEDYSELINSVSAFTCPRSVGDDSRAPTMCLTCGDMLCSQSYCCQTELDGNTVGAATAHADTCGAGTALFLRVRECQVLLLQGRSKGCFYPPPYLDDYGETDQGLRRGNPLHLSAESYKKLHKIWLSHSIPEKIAHLLEHSTNLMTIEWQHL